MILSSHKFQILYCMITIPIFIITQGEIQTNIFISRRCFAPTFPLGSSIKKKSRAHSQVKLFHIFYYQKLGFVILCAFVNNCNQRIIIFNVHLTNNDVNFTMQNNVSRTKT
jgi:hypothetical protein